MHDLGTRMLLRHYLEMGTPKAELSRRFGVSRRTIHYWVESGQLDRDLEAGAARYPAHPSAGHKLDPQKGIIRDRLGEFPKLSAQRLFEEIRATGYPGGHSRVRDYVREVRPVELLDPVVRFETPPGRQGRVDFGSFKLPWGCRHALLVVLGRSRLLWLRFLPRQTMEVPFRGLEGAFERFGGVPEELLFDQTRAVTLSDGRGSGGELVVNPEFQRFARHWDFRPRACRSRRPRTKGKVERPVRHVREGFFYGRRFVNDEDLNEQAALWLEGTANVRRHGTTGKRPVDWFERDGRPALISRDGAVLFFQLINARHERASTVLTSNKGFDEWGAVLGDEVMAAALIDRLLHHCHIVNIRGNSCRMREHRELRESMRRPRREGKHRGRRVKLAACSPSMCAIFNCQKCAIFDCH